MDELYMPYGLNDSWLVYILASHYGPQNAASIHCGWSRVHFGDRVSKSMKRYPKDPRY